MLIHSNNCIFLDKFVSTYSVKPTHRKLLLSLFWKIIQKCPRTSLWSSHDFRKFSVEERLWKEGLNQVRGGSWEFSRADILKKTFERILYGQSLDFIFSLPYAPSHIIDHTGVSEFVGNKKKGESQNKCFKKEAKKKSHTGAYQGVRKVRFSEHLAYFVFLKHPFWDSPFCFVTDEFYDFLL